MPTRTPQTRIPSALLLLGMVGLGVSGAGYPTAVPAWAWLVVLALGVVMPLLGKQARTRRFDAAELRRNAKARRNLRIARRGFSRVARRLERRQDATEAQVAAGLSAEEVATLRKSFVDFAGDLQLVKEHVAKLIQARNTERFGQTFGGPEDIG